jgi:hypothetical protein
MSAADWSDIRRRAAAAREFTAQIEHVTFQLRTPTSFEAELAAAESQGVNSSHTLARAKRLLVQRAVVGWSGLLMRDVLTVPDGWSETEALQYDEHAVDLLLDAQPAWAGTLWDALMARMEQQTRRLEDAAKN